MYPQVFPVVGAIPDNWGWDGNPYDGDAGFNPDDSHSGHDIFGVNGQEIVSTTPGTITKAGWVDGGGWRVGITDPDGWYHYYAHMQEGSIAVSVGQQVPAGQFIGRVDQSGEAQGTSPHLHYGIQADGNWLPGFFQALINAFNRPKQPVPTNKGVETMILSGKEFSIPRIDPGTIISFYNPAEPVKGQVVKFFINCHRMDGDGTEVIPVSLNGNMSYRVTGDRMHAPGSVKISSEGPIVIDVTHG